jgi:DNA repair photolyase
MNGCVYCYANDSAATTARRYASHNLKRVLLIGEVSDGEKIIERKVKSDRQEQIKLF